MFFGDGAPVRWAMPLGLVYQEKYVPSRRRMPQSVSAERKDEDDDDDGGQEDSEDEDDDDDYDDGDDGGGGGRGGDEENGHHHDHRCHRRVALPPTTLFPVPAILLVCPGGLILAHDLIRGRVFVVASGFAALARDGLRRFVSVYSMDRDMPVVALGNPGDLTAFLTLDRLSRFPRPENDGDGDGDGEGEGGGGRRTSAGAGTGGTAVPGTLLQSLLKHVANHRGARLVFPAPERYGGAEGPDPEDGPSVMCLELQRQLEQDATDSGLSGVGARQTLKRLIGATPGHGLWAIAGFIYRPARRGKVYWLVVWAHGGVAAFDPVGSRLTRLANNMEELLRVGLRGLHGHWGHPAMRQTLPGERAPFSFYQAPDKPWGAYTGWDESVGQ